MSSTVEYERGPRCGQDNCRSKLYYRESGSKFCKNGHQQEWRQTQQDDEERGPSQGHRVRIQRERKENVSQIYHGSTAITLYLQAYQLILWKQCHSLVHTIGLPPQFESVVRDLWGLRLHLLKEKTYATSGDEVTFSSQPESAAEAEEPNVGKKWKVGGKAMPTLIETLGLLYLGMVLLHLPISMGEIHRWALREDIPFIRAVRFVPAVMKQRLPSEYLMALDTISILEPDDIRKTIHNLSLFYAHHFKITFPSLNTTLLLYGHIRYLALPVPLLPSTLAISTMLNVEFNFPQPNKRQRLSSLPELALITLLVIATKLYHPFDSATRPRHARSTTDPTILTINWSAWTEAQKSHDARMNPEDHLPRGSELNVTEEDAMSMTGQQLDDYMDFYERTFIDEERAETKKKGLPKQLLDMFPTGRLDGSAPELYSYGEQTAKEEASLSEKLSSVVGSLQVRPIIATHEATTDDEKELKIGSFYKRYRRVDELEGDARFFHEKVAEAVGIKLETLLIAVGQMERRLINWRAARVKEGLASDEDDGSD